MGEWENRELCPDGGCIGVIGKTGTCNVCGRAAPNWGDERRRGMADVAPDDDGDGDDRAAEAGTAAAPAVPHGGGGGDDWDRRTLCPDGACIGVVEASGRCSVCARTPGEVAKSAT